MVLEEVASIKKRCVPAHVPMIHVGTLREQQLDEKNLAAHCRNVDDVHAAATIHSEVGALQNGSLALLEVVARYCSDHALRRLGWRLLLLGRWSRLIGLRHGEAHGIGGCERLLLSASCRLFCQGGGAEVRGSPERLSLPRGYLISRPPSFLIICIRLQRCLILRLWRLRQCPSWQCLANLFLTDKRWQVVVEVPGLDVVVRHGHKLPGEDETRKSD
mmetsp:Transcript_89714/g.252960  ORF Transcript_89714/g.252960 Transcript_89714/m.252960 type:complete len:217 (-) Transcript_89714:56-706(-)